MNNVFKRRIVPLLPVVLLLGLTSVGLANALQDDGDTGPDVGPQPADYDGDITGYLVAAAEYRTAPKVPLKTNDEGEVELEFRATGCAEGSPITIELVPRLLPEEEAAANDALEDDDPAKLVQEPVAVVEEEEALADGSAYTFAIPTNMPLGFTRIRVTCLDADGNELTSETVIDLVDPVAFEEEQADAEEPAELVTTVDGKPAAAPAADASADDAADEESEG